MFKIFKYKYMILYKWYSPAWSYILMNVFPALEIFLAQPSQKASDLGVNQASVVRQTDCSYGEGVLVNNPWWGDWERNQSKALALPWLPSAGGTCGAAPIPTPGPWWCSTRALWTAVSWAGKILGWSWCLWENIQGEMKFLFSLDSPIGQRYNVFKCKTLHLCSN